jgi:hypothetical protein
MVDGLVMISLLAKRLEVSKPWCTIALNKVEPINATILIRASYSSDCHIKGTTVLRGISLHLANHPSTSTLLLLLIALSLHWELEKPLYTPELIVSDIAQDVFPYISR